MELIFDDFDITDFDACSKALALCHTLEGKLERLAFLINARERSGDLKPLLYTALVRRAQDQIRPCNRVENASRIIEEELTLEAYAMGGYAKRAVTLYGRVREALR